MQRYCTLQELETHWSILDLFDILEFMDLNDRISERQDKQMRTQQR